MNDRLLVCMLSVAAALIATFAQPTAARAQAVDCALTQPSKGTLGASNREIALDAGRRIHRKWTVEPWDTFVIEGNTLAEITLDPQAKVDCTASRKNDAYPLVFKSDVDEVLISLGMQTKPTKSYTACFSVGAGQHAMHLSADTVKKYNAQGFNPRQACMGLTSGQIRFHPETGERLPTYVIASQDEKNLSDEYLFYVPRCFAKGRTEAKDFGATMKPLGCNLRYHPWSGRRLDDAEAGILNKTMAIHVAGDAGESVADSESLAKDGSRKVTVASIEAIKQKWTADTGTDAGKK